MIKRELRESPRYTLRPLVRYVDEDQAVIELRIALPRRSSLQPHERPLPAEVLIEITGPDGFNDEQRMTLHPEKGPVQVRFQVVYPRGWWPAGMGEQALYTLTTTLLIDNAVTETRTSTVGLTSVRRAPDLRWRGELPHEFLVNGEVCPIRSILPVDLIDERRLLPVAGHSLLIVRGHYGPDVLYESADRTGLLLIQAVPIDPDDEPETDVAAEVDRLSAHPSLAGWFVGHLGAMRRCRVASGSASCDPSRNVFLDIPGAPAA